MILIKFYNFRKLFYIILILIFSDNIRAQEQYDLSRCVVTGLEQNFAVKIARNREVITGNNYTRGNAGFLPSVTTTNRFGGNVTTTTQNMNDGSQNLSEGIHNTTGAAGITLDMPLFRGFNIQTTYQKLSFLDRNFDWST